MTTANDAREDTGVEEPAIVWVHPRSWKADPRTRRYSPFPERNHSADTELGILRRSVEVMLGRQDARGSFYSDEEYRQGDKVDDQLGGASMLAYHLARVGPDEAIAAALERAVRFHLDHLVLCCANQPFRYSRFFHDRDTHFDWGGTLWSLWGAGLILHHGAHFLSPGTAEELRGVAANYWGFLSSYPLRDENPCHNQLLAYCEIGILYARAIGRGAIVTELMDYYHRFLRRARVRDRGYWIYTEFGRWDSHYGVLSWMMLEHLFAATGDPACAEDADAMALYFNEQVSAGGYYWGGPRNNECGLEEFPHLFAARAEELGLNRLLFQEPADLWWRLAVDGHYGKGLVTRMEVTLPGHGPARPLPPTPWHFQRGEASVCLRDDTKLHHLSAAGLELIPAASATEAGRTLRWQSRGEWKEDVLVQDSPRSSEALRYHDSKPFRLADAAGLTAMQRGYLWEIRQWWLSLDGGLLWVGQLMTHAFPRCDRIDFVLGTPVLTRTSGRPRPVTEVASAEGVGADTQGDAVSVLSAKYLCFGDVHVGATIPLEFVRPSKEAAHTFPLPGGRLWRDCASSNELRVHLSETPLSLECRDSLFFAVEIARAAPALMASRDPHKWAVESKAGIFRALQTGGVWRYTWDGATGKEELPHAGFGLRAPAADS